jgi:hypothetical protein
VKISASDGRRISFVQGDITRRCQRSRIRP